MEYSIVIEAPDTEGNFTAFNIPCDVLDSDFLMQPINEADYDSETQACVDFKEGKITSFYSHYVTKRRKKKNVKNCRIEAPAPRVGQDQALTIGNVSTATIATKSEDCGSCRDSAQSKTAAVKAASSSSLSVGEAPPPDPSFLMAPTLLGTTFGVAKNALSNVAVRRVACGRMPPYNLSTSAEGTTQRTFLTPNDGPHRAEEGPATL
jgi:hypothetical protein